MLHIYLMLSSFRLPLSVQLADLQLQDRYQVQYVLYFRWYVPVNRRHRAVGRRDVGSRLESEGYLTM